MEEDLHDVLGAEVPRSLEPLLQQRWVHDRGRVRGGQVLHRKPLKLFLLTEGPDKDATWLRTRPNEAMRLTIKHCINIAQCFYKPEIGGALKQPRSERYNWEQFRKGSRVAKRFFEPFLIVYDSILIKSRPATNSVATADNAPAAETADSVEEETKSDVAEQRKKKFKVEEKEEMDTFKKQCEFCCQREIDARVVLLSATGSDGGDLRKLVTKSRMYQNLTCEAPVMGFYDPKNARLCTTFEGHGLTHREPALGEVDFDRYVRSFSPLAHRDVMWCSVAAPKRTP